MHQKDLLLVYIISDKSRRHYGQTLSVIGSDGYVIGGGVRPQ